MQPVEPLCPTPFMPVHLPPTEEAVEGVEDLEEKSAAAEETGGPE